MKIFCALLIACLINIFVTALNAAEPRKMIVPYTPLTGASAPLWIAIEAKLFQKYGLEIAPLFISAGSTAIVPMIWTVRNRRGGRWSRRSQPFRRRRSDHDRRPDGRVYDRLFCQTGIKSVRELKGRTVGVTLGHVDSLFRAFDVTADGVEADRCFVHSNRRQLGSHRGALQR